MSVGLAKLLRRLKWKNGLSLQVQDQPGYKVRLCYFLKTINLENQIKFKSIWGKISVFF